jgi:branched-chain amino acid transport system ATP-binding protein
LIVYKLAWFSIDIIPGNVSGERTTKRAKMDKVKHDEMGKRVRRSENCQLEVEDVCTFYGEAQALKNVSLSVNANEVVTILGSNGAGKTTLLRTIAGVLTPRYGRIIFGGELIQGMTPNEIVSKGIASVPEGRNLFGPMSVSDNLLLGTYSLSARERRRILPVRLEMVFSVFPILKERLNQKAETLSGGEQQMLAIGRALMANPRLLCLDEPLLGLSPILTMEMVNLLKRMCRDRSVSTLLIEQNVRAALKIADYVYVLERGEIVVEGSAEELIASPVIQSAYLGG